MDQFLLSQILVAIAWIIELVSFQFKSKGKILSCLILSSILITAHFFLLEKTTAGALMIVIILRLLVAQITTHPAALLAFLVVNTLITVLTYTEVYDIMPFIAVTFLTIGVFQKSDKTMRLIMMPGTAIFIVYNILISSPMMVITETSFLLTNMVGYYRYYLRKS